MRRICRLFVYAVLCVVFVGVEYIMVRGGMAWWYLPVVIVGIAAVTSAWMDGFE